MAVIAQEARENRTSNIEKINFPPSPQVSTIKCENVNRDFSARPGDKNYVEGEIRCEQLQACKELDSRSLEVGNRYREVPAQCSQLRFPEKGMSTAPPQEELAGPRDLKRETTEGISMKEFQLREQKINDAPISDAEKEGLIEDLRERIRR